VVKHLRKLFKILPLLIKEFMEVKEDLPPPNNEWVKKSDSKFSNL